MCSSRKWKSCGWFPSDFFSLFKFFNQVKEEWDKKKLQFNISSRGQTSLLDRNASLIQSFVCFCSEQLFLFSISKYFFTIHLIIICLQIISEATST